MNVNPLSTPPTSAPSKTQPVNALRKAYGASPVEPRPAPASDRLELSGASHLLQLAKSADVRADKVQALRQQIADGTYDLDAKADVVADRMLEDLMLDDPSAGNA